MFLIAADRYPREITSDKLSEFILTKLEPTTDEDVFPYRRGTNPLH